MLYLKQHLRAINDWLPELELGYHQDVEREVGGLDCNNPDLHTERDHYNCTDCHAEVYAGFDYIRTQRVDSRVAASTESMLTNQVLPTLAALSRLGCQIYQEGLVCDYYHILHDSRRTVGPWLSAIDRVVNWATGYDPDQCYEPELRGEAKKKQCLVEGQEMIRMWLEKGTIKEQGGGRWDLLQEARQLIQVAKYQAAKAEVANYEWVEKGASSWTRGSPSGGNQTEQSSFRQRVARQ